MALDDKREHAPPPEIQNHRLKNSPSKLPSFRFTDAQLGTLSQQRVAGQAEDATQTTEAQESPTTTTTTTRRTSLDELSPRQLRLRTVTISVFSTNNNPTAATTTKANKDRPASDPPRSSPGTGVVNDPPSPCITFQAKPTTTRKPPASRSRNGINLDSRPPLAMTTQKSYSLEAQGRPPSSSNTDAWVANQQTISLPTSSIETKTGAPQQGAQSLAVDERRFSRTKISPIRQFKPSRNSLGLEMPTSRQAVQDNDVTLRALEGFSERTSRHHDVDEQHSDDSDLFLKMAKEEGLARQQDTSRDLNLPTRSNSRRSRIGLEQNRQSMPPSTTYQAPPRVRRRSDQESATGSRIEGGEGMSKALTYQSSTAGRDRPSALDNINQSRYYGGNSRSTPTTPRVFGGSRESREISPESQVPYTGRRPSVPDHTSVLPRSSSYRQSNLSYTSPRTYNSSPLVSRSMDTNETPEAPNVPEGTVSTASTTAASTVWDELEDLKSRIHRLELTGKLPPTSGAAISHASGERPPTATTTVTTMSSSPKRNSGNSNNNPSPAEFAAAAVPEDNHPLLRAALVKSKPLLSAEVYSALEATTQDALSIAAMMGTSGQPGPISSSQTTVNGTGGAPSVSDRQVRRKADSMCRSLTELCLALSEAKIEPAQPNASDTTLRPKSRDDELMQSIEVSPTSQQPSPSNVVRIKNSPRALSRLEARRSSILATSALPSPRYMASEAGTPTQSTMTGRRTSLFLRAPRRAGTEEPQEEEDESRFRTPSRAVTDVNRLRGSPREYTSQQALPDTRPPTVQSALPVRRHFISTSLPTVAVLPSPVVPTLGARRFLERSTPERETGNGVSRLAEDRGPRKSSISGGFGLNRVSTLDRRARQTSLEPAPAQPGYH